MCFCCCRSLRVDVVNLVGVFVLILKRGSMQMVSPTRPLNSSGCVLCVPVVTFHSAIAYSVDDCGWDAAQAKPAHKAIWPT